MLTARERLLLNQIRGNSYLHLFALVEEFILPYALDHARDGVHDDKVRVRALATFAEEEAKHQQLFQAFGEEFARVFPVVPRIIGPAKVVSDKVLAYGRLGVALLVLHLEWLTQHHYVESVKSDVSIDPLFASLLKHHWQEESQHAKVDTLIIGELAALSSAQAIERGFDDFLAMSGFLDEALQQQVDFDLLALQAAVERDFEPEQLEAIR